MGRGKVIFTTETLALMEVTMSILLWQRRFLNTFELNSEGYHGNPQVQVSSGGRASRFRNGAGLPFMTRDQTAIVHSGVRSSSRLQASRRSSGGGHVPSTEEFGGSQPRNVSPEVRGRQSIGDILNLGQAPRNLQHLRRPASRKRSQS